MKYINKKSYLKIIKRVNVSLVVFIAIVGGLLFISNNHSKPAEEVKKTVNKTVNKVTKSLNNAANSSDDAQQTPTTPIKNEKNESSEGF